jgi:hypothetical protein
MHRGGQPSVRGTARRSPPLELPPEEGPFPPDPDDGEALPDEGREDDPRVLGAGLWDPRCDEGEAFWDDPPLEGFRSMTPRLRLSTELLSSTTGGPTTITRG